LYIKSGYRIKVECLCAACISGYYLPPASSRSIVHDIYSRYTRLFTSIERDMRAYKGLIFPKKC